MSRAYPDTPGHRGVDTSIAAAEAIIDYTAGMQRVAYRAILAAGVDSLTTDEVEAQVGAPRWRLRPRTSELRAKGLIVDSGRRRRNSTGKQAIIGVTAGAGLAVQLGKYSADGDEG